jgi:primosomal protein N' (replication factor Y)
VIFADVILPLPLKNVFTYEVPKDFHDLKVGMRVIVQFGQKKFYTALVYAIHNTPPSNYTAKQIQEVLDSLAIVS